MLKNLKLRKAFVATMFAALTLGFAPAFVTNASAAPAATEESTCLVDEDGDGVVHPPAAYGRGNVYRLEQILGCVPDDFAQPQNGDSEIFRTDNGTIKIKVMGEEDTVIFDYLVNDVWTTAWLPVYAIQVEVKRKRHPKRLIITNNYEHVLWAKVSNHSYPEFAAKVKIDPGDTKTLRVKYNPVYSWQFVRFLGKWRFLDSGLE